MEELRQVKSRIIDVEKVLSRMQKVLRCRAMVVNVKRRLYEGVALLIALNRDETWNMGIAEKKILDVE